MSTYRKPKAEPPQAELLECFVSFAGAVADHKVTIPEGTRMRANDPVAMRYPQFFLPSDYTSLEKAAALLALRNRHDRPRIGRVASVVRSMRGDPAA